MPPVSVISSGPASLVDPAFVSNPFERLACSDRPAPPDSWLFHFEQSSIISADPEGHRRWRHRLSAGFTPRAVRRMDQQVRAVVEEFAAPIRGRTGPVDQLAAFTDPIPNTVIGRVIGIPPYPGDGADWEQIEIMLRPLRLVVDFGPERRCG